ncbi:uncharacterized protein LOC144024498 [Festucalex cinctus]
MNTISNQAMASNDVHGNFSTLKSMHMKLMNLHYSTMAEKDHYYNELHLSSMKNIKLQKQLILYKDENKKNGEIIADQADEIAYLKESLQAQQEELQQSRLRVRKQQDQVCSLEESLHEQREELRQSEKKVHMQKSQIYTLENTMSDQKKEFQQKDLMLQRQEAQIAVLQQTLQDRTTQLEQSVRKAEELQEKFQSYMESAKDDKCDRNKEEKLMENIQACHARVRSMENLQKKKRAPFLSGLWSDKKKKKAPFWPGFCSDGRQDERAGMRDIESRKKKENENESSMKVDSRP